MSSSDMLTFDVDPVSLTQKELWAWRGYRKQFLAEIQGFLPADDVFVSTRLRNLFCLQRLHRDKRIEAVSVILRCFVERGVLVQLSPKHYAFAGSIGAGLTPRYLPPLHRNGWLHHGGVLQREIGKLPTMHRFTRNQMLDRITWLPAATPGSRRATLFALWPEVVGRRLLLPDPHSRPQMPTFYRPSPQ